MCGNPDNHLSSTKNHSSTTEVARTSNEFPEIRVDIDGAR